VERDGNGWIECSLGHRHWGLHGAAGLLLHNADADGTLRLLLQHRAEWCHHGGTWGLPGGARDSHETVEQAALREAAEETSIDITQVRVRHTFVDDHGGWSYTTVYGDTVDELATDPNEESAELSWVATRDVADLPLHPGFGHTWPEVRLPAATLVVDAANVVGSVPDGWWKDRAGATSRLASRLVALASATVPLDQGAGVVTSVHLVLEGKARQAEAPQPIHRVVAIGSGDDAIVDTVADLGSAPDELVVVTSDRELRARVAKASDQRATLVGAGWLLDVLDSLSSPG
jgi:8-oxo-dGTP pyrophosphatase MutT (NUDIX family)